MLNLDAEFECFLRYRNVDGQIGRQAMVKFATFDIKRYVENIKCQINQENRSLNNNDRLTANSDVARKGWGRWCAPLTAVLQEQVRRQKL